MTSWNQFSAKKRTRLAAMAALMLAVIATIMAGLYSTGPAVQADALAQPPSSWTADRLWEAYPQLDNRDRLSPE